MGDPAPRQPPDDGSQRSSTGPPLEGVAFEPFEIELHGHRAVYRRAGTGPSVVLIHGMLNSSRHWEAVATRLASDYTVIAPDLLGHGDSATTQGDYSLGAHASGIRDVLSAIGVDHATIVGHSLGGGVAMQFFYQFPQRCERLVLISSGGLGREVSWPLRLTAAPGAEGLVALASSRPALWTLDRAAGSLRARGAAMAGYLRAAGRALGELEGRAARRAFLHTLRSVIGAQGQRVNAQDRLYLAGALPALIVWGARDNTIPIEHGHAAHAAIPGSRLSILDGVAHFPHLEDPDALADALREFLASTGVARLDAGSWRGLLDEGIRRHGPHVRTEPARGPAPSLAARARSRLSG